MRVGIFLSSKQVLKIINSNQSNYRTRMRLLGLQAIKKNHARFISFALLNKYVFEMALKNTDLHKNR